MKFLVYNIAYGTGAPRNRLDQVLGLYRYLHTGRKHLEKIIDCIDGLNPDVTGLLEVDCGSLRTGYLNQGELIGRALNQTVYGAVKYAPGSVSRKIPILRRQSNIFLTAGKKQPCAFHYLHDGMKRLALEIEIGGIRFFLLHLALGKTVRRKQLKTLSEILGSLKTPYLIGGDFNAFNGTTELEQFMEQLGLRSANGADLPTFPAWKPVQQLDYILYSKGIEPVHFAVGTEQASDHLPLMLEFKKAQ